MQKLKQLDLDLGNLLAEFRGHGIIKHKLHCPVKENHNYLSPGLTENQYVINLIRKMTIQVKILLHILQCIDF